MPERPLLPEVFAAALALPMCGGCEEPVPPASLIDRRAERPASESEKKPRGRDCEGDTARAERAAALDRAASGDLVANIAGFHTKLRRAGG